MSGAPPYVPETPIATCRQGEQSQSKRDSDRCRSRRGQREAGGNASSRGEEETKKKKKSKVTYSGGNADRNPYEIPIDNEEEFTRQRFVHEEGEHYDDSEEKSSATTEDVADDPRRSKRPRKCWDRKKMRQMTSTTTNDC